MAVLALFAREAQGAQAAVVSLHVLALAAIEAGIVGAFGGARSAPGQSVGGISSCCAFRSAGGDRRCVLLVSERGIAADGRRRLLFAGVTRVVLQIADLLQTLGVLRLQQNVLFRDDSQFGGRAGLAQCVAGDASVDAAVVDRDGQSDVAEIGEARTGL